MRDRDKSKSDPVRRIRATPQLLPDHQGQAEERQDRQDGHHRLTLTVREVDDQVLATVEANEQDQHPEHGVGVHAGD